MLITRDLENGLAKIRRHWCRRKKRNTFRQRSPWYFCILYSKAIGEREQEQDREREVLPCPLAILRRLPGLAGDLETWIGPTDLHVDIRTCPRKPDRLGDDRSAFLGVFLGT